MWLAFFVCSMWVTLNVDQQGSEASILEAVICWGRHQVSKQPGSTLPDVLASVLPRIQLDSIPANILPQLVKGTGLLSYDQVAAVQASQEAQIQPCLSRQYARRYTDICHVQEARTCCISMHQACSKPRCHSCMLPQDCVSGSCVMLTRALDYVRNTAHGRTPPKKRIGATGVAASPAANTVLRTLSDTC